MPRLLKETFAIIPRCLVENPKISLKAKGLYAFLYNKPEHWEFTIANMTSELKESKDAISSAIRELVLSGYITKKITRNSQGQWESDYILHNKPVKKPQKAAQQQSHQTSITKQNIIIEYIKQYIPILTNYPGLRQICETIEDKPLEFHKDYILYVAQTKKGEAIFNVKGWTDWYWQDFYAFMNTPKDKRKTVIYTEEELHLLKHLDVNPYGQGKWKEQFYS